MKEYKYPPEVRAVLARVRAEQRAAKANQKINSPVEEADIFIVNLQKRIGRKQ